MCLTVVLLPFFNGFATSGLYTKSPSACRLQASARTEVGLASMSAAEGNEGDVHAQFLCEATVYKHQLPVLQGLWA